MEPTRADLVAMIDDPVAFLTSESPILRRLAVTSLEPAAVEDALPLLADLGRDESPEVRAAVAEALGLSDTPSDGPSDAPSDAGASVILDRMRDDPSEVVREAVATAYGERGDVEAVEWLIDEAASDPDRAVREAAVASLGAIGDSRAIEPLLALVASAPPQVRRRAVAAITVFDDDRVHAAITRAAFDRNPGVREAAEMVVGRQLGPAPAPE